MPLAAGTRLGPYEIVAPLGAGGMGEVFRAKDTRLGRDVAIKVLPQHLSANPEVRTRFEREAKTVSSLNHPNICTLFDVGREGDTDYLVMELVDGETLAQRLARGALPSAELLKLAAQIADALSRAHRAGVIHRDLKPGNVMLTKSGAKLMDFGLARATGLAGAGGTSGLSAALSQSPTMAAPLTAEGTIVGTFQYMAPEQLEGKEADARSDLWALGCVVYEMATGHRAFEGRSQASLISSIMSSDPPPIAQLAPLAPAGLDRLVRTCLAKDPDERAQTAHDVKLQLQGIAEEGPVAGLPASVTGAATPRPGRVRLAWSLMAVALLATVGVALAPRWFAHVPAASAVGHWNLVLPDAAPLDFFAPSLFGEGQPALTISHDGGRLAYVGRQNGTARLFFRRVDEADWHPLAGTEGASQPFFSPDGEWIGFFADDDMKKVAVAGGTPLTIARVSAPRGAVWAKDGRVFFSSRGNLTGFFSVPASGGNPAPYAGAPSDLYWPSLLPGEHWVLGSSGGRRLMLFSLDEKKVLTLGVNGPIPDESTDTANLLTGTLPRYVRIGHLVYLVGNSLMALPFYPERRRVLGPPTPVVQEVRREGWNGAGQYDVGEDGTLVFAPGADGARSVPVWADR